MNKGMKHIMLCLMLGLILTSCSDKGEIQSQRRWIKHTVAIVAPVEDEITKVRLERTATWFLENFRQAQLHNSTAIDLHLEWYDESSEDLVKLSRELSGREDVLAVIGPFGNEALAEFAPACQRTGKPLIAPTVTSEDIIRRYAVTTSGMRINRYKYIGLANLNTILFTI